MTEPAPKKKVRVRLLRASVVDTGKIGAVGDVVSVSIQDARHLVRTGVAAEVEGESLGLTYK